MCAAARRGLAVGFFDGVHLGHQAVLARAAAALTFRNHPLGVLSPGRAPHLLMSCDDRLAAIRSCGVRDVRALDFTPETAAMPAGDFVRTILSEACPDGVVFCGGDWRFGRGGEGDAAFLRAHGFCVEELPYAEYCGERISSTRIRAALAAGELGDAAAMLGREWCVRGVTAAGKGLGASLGFPTLNVQLPSLEIAIPRGVYAVEALGSRGIANFGVAPTMGASAWSSPVLEIHFPDGLPAPCAPGSPIEVALRRFVRPERTFASLAELAHQIALDCASC